MSQREWVLGHITGSIAGELCLDGWFDMFICLDGWLSEITVFVTGQVSLVGKPEGLGRRLTKGNVYLDGSPICDDGWSLKDATVACRFNLQPVQLMNVHLPL